MSFDINGMYASVQLGDLPKLDFVWMTRDEMDN